MAAEMINYDGKLVRRFVSYPEPIMDGTIRCGVCGQLDEEPFHDEETCRSVYDSNRAFRAAITEDKANGANYG